MKFVMLGKESMYDCLGIRRVVYETSGTELKGICTCTLEDGYTLIVYGGELTDQFNQFVKSNDIVIDLLGSGSIDTDDSTTNFIELFDESGELIYRYERLVNEHR